jgi:hypothetical protein
MTNPTIETDLAEILKEIKIDQKKLLEELTSLKIEQGKEVNDLKLGQAKIEGKIDALDVKIDGLDKRIGNQEFLTRGIFVGISLIVLGGAAKLFGLIPNP